VIFARPLRRRRTRTLAPVLVALRTKKPWVFARLRFLGWYVRFMRPLYRIYTQTQVIGEGLLGRGVAVWCSGTIPTFSRLLFELLLYICAGYPFAARCSRTPYGHIPDTNLRATCVAVCFAVFAAATNHTHPQAVVAYCFGTSRSEQTSGTLVEQELEKKGWDEGVVPKQYATTACPHLIHTL